MKPFRFFQKKKNKHQNIQQRKDSFQKKKKKFSFLFTLFVVLNINKISQIGNIIKQATITFKVLNFLFLKKNSLYYNKIYFDKNYKRTNKKKKEIYINA